MLEPIAMSGCSVPGVGVKSIVYTREKGSKSGDYPQQQVLTRCRGKRLQAGPKGGWSKTGRRWKMEHSEPVLVGCVIDNTTHHCLLMLNKSRNS